MTEEALNPGAKCECGQTLPWHLFELQVGMKHICSCARAYKERGGVVRFVGNETNPFTRPKPGPRIR